MRKGRSSGTAEFVSFVRALGTLAPQVKGFSDPAAEHFLPPRWAKRVQRARARLPRPPLPFWVRGMALFNQFRTAVLDRALLDALPFEQLVILGAGLDGRAWRLQSLHDVTVFEVDHPDTQAVKKQRTSALPCLARDVRFVPVDFRSDALATRLEAGGFDPRRKTFWLWEGVTVYLTPADVRKTLEIMGHLSSLGSRVAMTYFARDRGRMPRSFFLALLGEPVQSAFSEAELSSLVMSAGWSTLADSGFDDWKPVLAPDLALTARQVGIQRLERVWVGERR